MEKINTDFENWGSYLMKQFHTMFEKSERCDLEISCNKQIFLVHRLVMSACSDYVRELGETQHIILPEEISCKTLKTIIDFVYSGKIIFHKEDKEDLLIAASLLNMRLLLELIRREDSSSYTISMDDDIDENCETELINSGAAENCRINVDDGSSREQNSHAASKRKSDKKSVKNKSPKKNCVVLPPLHKFPYLQQKFSGTRTYGLITNLTSPTPSRFEISEAELENSSVRSTFHDVTYDTQRLSEPDKLKSLEASHIQFLKKQKTASVNRRNYTNALYSPFDKYTPPCNLKLSDSVITRRPESVISYPSKVDAASGVRKYHANNNVHSREINGRPPSSRIAAALSSSALPTTKEYKKQDTTKTTSNSTNYPPEKRVRFSDDVTIREIDIPFTEALINDLETLPEPIMPSAVMQDATSLSDNGQEVELIKLNNVVVPSELRDDRTTTRMEPEENIVSISLVQTDTCETRNTITESSSHFTTNETMEVEENQSSCQVSSQLETNNSTTSVTSNETNVNQVPNPCSVDAVDSVSEESFGEENIDIRKGSQHPSINDLNGTERVSQPATLLSSVDRVSTDATLFTPLNTNTNSAQTSSELNSQIFALKVKGTESPAQLDKLVDLCKNNPLFKNKNIRFKIVPVKGVMREKLRETTLKTNRGINKAIIVKRTENSTTQVATSSVETSSMKVADVPQRAHASDEGTINWKKDRVALIENITGPWDCTRCGAKPLTFNSYYDYRTHLHSVHKEPNNPIYCTYCGHKSLKRNMQLYHLFIKHNVKPPSHIKFPKCDKCEFYALNEYYLQKHLICHPSEGMEYVCSCKVAFKSCELLQKHMVSGDCKNTRSFTCGYCRGIFDRFVNLKAHMRVCMKERSKPMLENSIGNANPERSTRKSVDCGRDYVAL